MCAPEITPRRRRSPAIVPAAFFDAGLPGYGNRLAWLAASSHLPSRWIHVSV